MRQGYRVLGIATEGVAGSHVHERRARWHDVPR